MGRRLPWTLRTLRRGLRETGPPQNAEAERESLRRGNRTPPVHPFLNLHFRPHLGSYPNVAPALRSFTHGLTFLPLRLLGGKRARGRGGTKDANPVPDGTEGPARTREKHAKEELSHE